MYEILEWAYNQVQTNQFLIAAMFATGMYLLRSVPLWFYAHIKRNLTLDFSTEINDDIYTSVLQYCDRFRINMFSRNYSLRTRRDRDDYEDETSISIGKNLNLSIGYGTSVMWYKSRLVVINRVRNDGAAISENKEHCNFTFFTRKREIMADFLRESYDFHTKKDGVQISKSHNTFWSEIGRVNRRPMESIFIDKTIKNELIQKVQWFLENEEWYVSRGINYKLGIILSGPPGSGKSSVVRALASHFGFDINYLELNAVTDLSRLMMNATGKLVVIEDIDCAKFTHQRRGETVNDDDDEPSFTPRPNTFAELTQGPAKSVEDINKTSVFDSSAQLSQLLNVFDGALTPHKTIFIATTNHFERLDSALIRPGRIDLHVEIASMQRETFVEMIAYLYQAKPEDVEANLSLFAYKDMLGSKVQSEYFGYKDDMVALFEVLFDKRA